MLSFFENLSLKHIQALESRKTACTCSCVNWPIPWPNSMPVCRVLVCPDLLLHFILHSQHPTVQLREIPSIDFINALPPTFFHCFSMTIVKDSNDGPIPYAWIIMNIHSLLAAFGTPFVLRKCLALPTSIHDLTSNVRPTALLFIRAVGLKWVPKA